MQQLHPLALGMPGMTEWIIIGAIGLLIFGKRLPEVGRGLGKSIVEFKRGLKGIEDEVTMVDPQPEPARKALPDHGPKFDPYTGKPVGEESASPDAGHHA